MPHTLRSFLDTIDNRVLHIRDEVDPVSQVGYLCSESKHPLLFHNLADFPGWRLTDILIKDRHGQAAALGVNDVKEVCPFLAIQNGALCGSSVSWTRRMDSLRMPVSGSLVMVTPEPR